MFRTPSIVLMMLLAAMTHLAFAATAVPAAITEPVPITQLADFAANPPIVQDLIMKALQLSRMNLTYLYGSSDPVNKGMDCSGTMHYLLNMLHVRDAPRQSDQFYNWVASKGKLYKVTSIDFKSPEFSHLKPGDLLFWTGTYSTKRASGISHVMLYIGTTKSGQRLMFGSSDGRSYQGKKMWGVSVFDFKLPDNKDTARFVGYGCIPALTCQ